MNVTNLAPEILLVILTYIQPDLDPFDDIEQSPQRIVDANSPFHTVISLSRGSAHKNARLPSLLVFGSVNRLFRNTSLMHSLWATLRWHILLPSTCRLIQTVYITSSSSSEEAGTVRPALEIPFSFFSLFKRVSIRLLRVRYAILDFGALGWEVTPNTIGGLLDGLHVERLESLVLNASWKTVANLTLIKLIALKFKSIKYLSIRGQPCSSVLFGLSSKELATLEPCVCSLTKLSLSSYGSNSFSLPSLLSLLRACKATLRDLSLWGGPISNGDLALYQVGEVVGDQLESLSLAFSYGGFNDDIMCGWEPAIHGNLEPFKNLKKLRLSDQASHPGVLPDDPFPLHMVTQLLSSLRTENDESEPLAIAIHFQMYKLSSLHAPVLYASLANRLVTLELSGDMKTSRREDIVRRFTNLVSSCSSLKRVAANYSKSVAKEVRAVAEANNIGISLLK
ncbi:hypothetical protein BC830DRAFT_1171855 [Chytriomyces sp. MP71]|nr:hypothetical protein BC830DRAFT_1171855 [Chytriomyces sp. MP71]